MRVACIVNFEDCIQSHSVLPNHSSTPSTPFLRESQTSCVRGIAPTVAPSSNVRKPWYLNTMRLWSARIHAVRDPPGRQKEQSNERPSPHLRVVMGSRPWTRPSRTLPTLHTLQLRRLIDLHNAIDLAVGMPVILSRVHVLAVHVHGRYAEEAIIRTGKGDFAAAISVAVELGFRDPTFLKTLEDVLAKVLVVWIAGTVMSVQALFQIFSWCTINGWVPLWWKEEPCDHSQILHLSKELHTSGVELLGCWVGVDIEDTSVVAIRGSCHCQKKKRHLDDISREDG